MASVNEKIDQFLDWALKEKGAVDIEPPLDGDVIPFVSRRASMSPEELRDLNDKRVMDRLFENFQKLNAAAPVMDPGPRVEAPSDAGLGDAQVNAPDAPTRAPGPPLARPSGGAGLNEGPLPYTGGPVNLREGPVNSNMWREGYRARDILLPPLTINRAFRNATGAPLREEFSNLGRFAYYTGWAGHPRYEMAVRGKKLLDDAIAAQEDQGLITNRINKEFEPKLKEARKALADASKGRSQSQITTATNNLNALLAQKDDAIAAVTANDPDALRAEIDKQIGADWTKTKNKIKKGAKLGAAGLAAVGGTVATTLAAKAIMDANAGGEDGDLVVRFARGQPMTDDEIAEVEDMFPPEEFEALQITRNKGLGIDYPQAKEPLFFQGGAGMTDGGGSPATPAASPVSTVEDWNDITQRYVSGGDLTPEEVAAMQQFLSPETMAELDGYRAAVQPAPASSPGPSAPSYKRPEVVEPEATMTAEEVLALMETDPAAAAAYVQENQNQRDLDAIRNYVDAGIQNFAGALDLPESIQGGLRNAAEGARTGQVGDVVPDNVVTDVWDGYSDLWSEYVMNPYESWKRGGDPNDPSFLRRPAAAAAKALLPEDAYRAYEDYGIGEFLDPMNYADMILGTKSDELGQGVYNLAREGLTAMEAEGTTPESFVEPYRKILGDLGGQPLGYPGEQGSVFEPGPLPAFGGARPELAPGGMPPAPALPPDALSGFVRPELTAAGMPAAAAGPAPIVEPQAPGMPMGPDAEPQPPSGGGISGFFGDLFGSGDDQQAKDESIDGIIDGAEVLNPRGQIDASPRPLPRPAGLNEDVAPAIDVTVPTVSAPAVATPTTPAGRPAPGAVGDLNTSRERGVAGLAEDAEAAEEELNWINRMMRDKLGLTDASERAKAAEALVSFGSTVLASKGDTWQSIGEGLQAGLGSVLAANDEEAASIAAQQEAMEEDARWRADYALRELNARRGGGAAGGMPADVQKLEYLTGIFYEQLMASGGMTAEQAAVEAQRMATDRIFEAEAAY
jgi:hypothetical protein